MPSNVNDLLAADTGLLALHDRLLTEMPEGAVHDEDACPLCAMSLEDGGADDSKGGSMSDKTFTEVELQAAVDKAVADATAAMQAKLAELEGNQALETAVATAKAELEAQVADLQTKLDAAVAEATQAKEAKEALETAVQAEKDEAAAAAEIAARIEDRTAKVKEIGCFPDEYLTANAERFAAMSEEDFTARLDEWKAIGKKEEIPAKTAFKAAREGSAGGGTESALGDLRELRMADARTL